MQVIETTVYTYDELSEDAKIRARDWYREGQGDDGFYSDSVIDDAKHIGGLLGIGIDRVFFSGFHSQGDGASFEGSYAYKPGWKKALLAYAPKDNELLRIGAALQNAQNPYFYKLKSSCTHSGFYQHSGCMRVNTEHAENRHQDIGTSEDDVRDALRDFADWIYRQLENDYDYLNSDDCVAETIRANEYRFTEDGTRF